MRNHEAWRTCSKCGDIYDARMEMHICSKKRRRTIFKWLVIMAMAIGPSSPIFAQVPIQDLEYADSVNMAIIPIDATGEPAWLPLDSLKTRMGLSDAILTITQPYEAQRIDSNYVIFEQEYTDTIEYYVDGLVYGDQNLSLDGNLLSIENSNTVDLSDIVPRIDGVEMVVTGVDSYTPSFDLPTNLNRVGVYINGVRLTYNATPTHISEYYISSNTIHFYENLDNDIMSIVIF